MSKAKPPTGNAGTNRFDRLFSFLQHNIREHGVVVRVILTGALLGAAMTSLELAALFFVAPTYEFFVQWKQVALSAMQSGLIAMVVLLFIDGRRPRRTQLFAAWATLLLGHQALWVSRSVVVYSNQTSHLNVYSIAFALLAMLMLWVIVRYVLRQKERRVHWAALAAFVVITLLFTVSMSRLHHDDTVFLTDFRKNHAPVDHRLIRKNAPQEANNVLLVVADTLRADELGCAGNPANHTPHLDALAARGTLFTQCFSVSSWTAPAMGTLLTGLSPRRHGKTEFYSLLDNELITVPEYFRAGGFHTFAVSTNPILKSYFGFMQGFDRFIETAKSYDAAWWLTGTSWRRWLGPLAYKCPATIPVNDADMAVERFLELLDIAPPDRPFFAWVHLMDPHTPYAAPEPYRQKYVDGDPPDFTFRNDLLDVPRTTDAKSLKAYRGLYRGEVAFLDDQVGRLMAELERRGRLEDTTIVFTADHGEHFRRHGLLLHGYSLFDPETHVPLIVAPPKPPDRRLVEQPRQLLDVPSALFDLAGLARPVDLPGDGLRYLFSEEERPLFLETQANMHGVPINQIAVIDGPRRLILDRTKRLEFFFPDYPTQSLHNASPQAKHLSGLQVGAIQLDAFAPNNQPDPCWKKRSCSYADDYRRLRDLLKTYEATTPTRPANPVGAMLDQATRSALRSLGYIR